MVQILDALTTLAAFFDKPGADVTAMMISDALLSTSNSHGIVAKLADRGLPTHEILLIRSQLDVEVVPVITDRR